MKEKGRLVIIQARMGSARLPGKTLMDLAGESLLSHICNAVLSQFDRSELIVATSKSNDCDKIEEFCSERSISVFRGSENDVASRFFHILSTNPSIHFARISADSPLMDPAVLVDGFDEAKKSDADIISTVGNFPSGMNVEIIKTKMFLGAFGQFSTSDHFEHVTKYFYENPSLFNIQYLDCPVSEGNKYKFSVDTMEDKLKMEKIFSVLKKQHYSYSIEEKCKIHDQFFYEAKC